MLTGNKGEWSEIYTFFKLLADTKLYAGDANLKKIDEVFYPIIKILRQEYTDKYEYSVDNNVILVFGGSRELRIPTSKFKDVAENLFQSIKDAHGVFPLPYIEDFMNSIYCYSLKAKSTDKSDIKIIIHDLRTGLQHLLGFSIKSKLGGASTLLNSNSDNTNFIFELQNINYSIVSEVNKIPKFKDKFDKLRFHNVKVKFHDTATSVLRNNLLYVDYGLPAIIADIILKYYSSQYSKVSDILRFVRGNNVLNFDDVVVQDFYGHKVKRFLTDVALGMKPGKPWNGKFDATGGYLIVKENGEVICYHIYDRNQFEDYLFNNTKLDTPSTSRHQFGDIYEIQGRFFIKLNLQIRFI